MVKSDNLQPNRLINEKSPYLLQHAYNPVDWYPWGEEAFKKAKAENKPLFLSIGYSTCHWCHVMEKDSFEDEEVAALLNKHYVAVKIDREERPDLDQQFMAACQALTGQGGWPLSVFLTPDLQPFYAGTFFPKVSRYGISGMMDILPRISEYWLKEKERVVQAAKELTGALSRMAAESRSDQSELPVVKSRQIISKAFEQLKQNFDQQYGGFGAAPKFPTPHQLLFLLRYGAMQKDSEALAMVEKTLIAFHRGGIFDQLGFGIHRYSVDSKWLVPHFEKMLYDQALTLLAAAEAYRLSGNLEVRALAEKIVTYLLKDMQAPGGAFFAAEDADSEGEEGTYYVWRLAELFEHFGSEQGQLLADYYGVTAEGNFEHGLNVLSRPHSDAEFASLKGLKEEELHKLLETAREKMLKIRTTREKPFLDDKVITAWNGLVIAALARAGVVMEKPAYVKEAERAAAFILKHLTLPSGQLLRRYREQQAAINGFLDDYAAMVWAYLELYRATLKEEYLKTAAALNEQMMGLFATERGALNYSLEAAEEGLPPLEAEAYDGAVPSGFSMAVMNQLRLGRLIQDDELIQRGTRLLALQGKNLEKQPTAYTYLLTALDYLISVGESLTYCPAGGNCDLE
jgi:uncharacterized protein